MFRAEGGLLWDAPLEASTSTFFEDLAKHPDTHPLFVMPYRGMSSSRPHWLAVHRQPVSQGINEAEDFLLPESANTRDADHPTLAYLKQAGRSIDARVVGAPPADMAADLQALGFHYAVLWRMDRPREQVYVRWFGPPDHEGPLVLAWDLRASR